MMTDSGGYREKQMTTGNTRRCVLDGDPATLKRQGDRDKTGISYLLLRDKGKRNGSRMTG